MPQAIIITVVILGILGGGYYLLNPAEVYVDPESIQMREIVVDDGESTLQKKFTGNESERAELIESLTKKVEVPTSTPVIIESTTTATTTEDIKPKIVLDPNTYTLALGDGNISSEPKRGSVYACKDEFPDAPAQKSGPWIQKDVWYPLLKFSVIGDVYRTNANVTFASSGASRIARGNGLPLHGTGEFPIKSSDKGYRYDKNPNRIKAQDSVFVFPLNPELAEAPTCLRMGPIAITLTGVPLFNALDAYGRDALAHEVQDTCQGHPDQSGTYHYHSESECLTKYAQEKDGVEDSLLLGYAIDGFGIYAQIENNKQLTNKELDSCHGHTHRVPWDGEEVEMYHYHATAEYPYTLGCFMGTPVLENN